MGGEKGGRVLEDHTGKGSPPRGRGKAAQVQKLYKQDRITPAWAGKRFLGQSPEDYKGDHPRVGGEKLSERLK